MQMGSTGYTAVRCMVLVGFARGSGRTMDGHCTFLGPLQLRLRFCSDITSGSEHGSLIGRDALPSSAGWVRLLPSVKCEQEASWLGS
jgi:hypothetical protein